MTRTLRLAVFAVAMLCLLPAVWRIAGAMPPFGAHPLPYGDAINARGTAERRVTNMVSAVNFDYRGFDTLGEEFMLVCAVTGAVVLLRGGRGESVGAKPGALPHRPIAPRSDAIVLYCRFAGALTVLFGLYVILHATVTPGGGFQGGVIVASGAMFVFIGEGYRSWRGMMCSPILDALEGGGAALYAVAGFASILAGQPFLTNVLPLGTVRDLYSGGLMLVVNFGVALAVVGSFGLLMLEFLEETRQVGQEEP